MTDFHAILQEGIPMELQKKELLKFLDQPIH